MNIKRYIVILLVLFIVSCTPDFSTPKYRKKFTKKWKRKRIFIYQQGTFNDPNVKSEYRQSRIHPRTISLDKW